MHTIASAVCVLLFVAPATFRSAGPAQIEIDRTLVRIYGVPIMASDVRQARLMHLVDPGDGGDRAAQTALENRLLMLREVTRGGIQGPDSGAIAARRRAWTGRLPGGFDQNATMARAGMTTGALEQWFADDVRIEEYLSRRFGQVGDPRRAERVSEWIRDLRRRAGLELDPR
jgi:hypothetical protein